MDKGLQRAITLKELTPSLYFSIINVQLADIKFYEILSLPFLPFQDIEKPKCRRRTNRQTDVKTVYPTKHSLQGAIITDITLQSLT